MLKHTIIFAVVAGLVLALAPAAQAAIDYIENFVGTTHGQTLASSGVGWTGHHTPLVGTATTWGGVTTPDGDDWFVRWYIGESMSFYASTGEYVIPSAERNNTVFTVDYATQDARGMKIVAKVDGIWYGSETFGTGTGDHGTTSGGTVTRWEVDVSANAETGTWYKLLKTLTSRWEVGTANAAWDDDNPRTGVPAGDITEFGVNFDNVSNNRLYAADNFRVIPEPATMALLGLGGIGLLIRRHRRS